jgi:hypothetical protein
MTPELGRLESVDLRKVWPHEALDFTNWLAVPENLSFLGSELGITDISLIEREASSGRFSVDILAEDQQSNRKIVIENQLEMTNHDHLGKIITYASGRDAEVVVWIVKDAHAEHRQAIDWLNEHTDERLNFFLIKMELWQIAASPAAPKFQILCRPNNWAKAVKAPKRAGDGQTELRVLQIRFWESFLEFFQNQDTTGMNPVKPGRAQHYCDIKYGSTKSHLGLTIVNRRKEMGCEVYIPGNKDLFKHLLEHKDEIERDTGHELEWMDLPNPACRIKLTSEADLNRTDAWEGYFRWLLEKAQVFQRVFRPLVLEFESRR